MSAWPEGSQMCALKHVCEQWLVRQRLQTASLRRTRQEEGVGLRLQVSMVVISVYALPRQQKTVKARRSKWIAASA